MVRPRWTQTVGESFLPSSPPADANSKAVPPPSDPPIMFVPYRLPDPSKMSPAPGLYPSPIFGSNG
jgi:hypothetical protein